MLHLMSGLILGLLLIGFFLRRKTRIHSRIMQTAFALDVGLVLYIEATRHAVEKVVTGSHWILWIHGGISLVVIAGYIALFWLGKQLLAGRRDLLYWHRPVGIMFLMLRILNYVTSFML